MNEDALTLRLRGYLAGRPLTGPETVHVDLANACDLGCVTCWNHAPELARPKPAEWKRLRMAPELFERLARELADAGVERVILGGGGEPFTHPAIDRFIDLVKSHGLRLTVITNGLRCDFGRMAEQGVDQVLLNLASATPQTYAAYHQGPAGQVPDAFHRLTAGAKRMPGRINLVQVVNRINFGELPAMVELGAALRARCSFKMGDAPMGTERHALADPDRRELVERLIPAAREAAKRLSVKHNLDAFEAQLNGRDRPAPQPSCFAGYLYSRIWVDGSVFFCCEHVEAGSVADRPFGAIWRSATYDALRDRIGRGERFPGCARCGKHDMNFAAARALDALRVKGELP